MFANFGGDDQSLHDEIMEISRQVKLLNAKPSPDEAATLQEELTPIVAELEKTAGLKERAKQQLLWASHDCLARHPTSFCR